MKSIPKNIVKACVMALTLMLNVHLSVAFAEGIFELSPAQPSSPALRRVALESNDVPDMQLLRDIWLLTAEQLGIESELYILPPTEFQRALMTPQRSSAEAEALHDQAATPDIDWFIGLREDQIEQAGLSRGPQILSRDVTLFQRRQMPAIQQITDAAGFVVGVTENSHTEQWLIRHYPQLMLRAYRSFSDLLDAALAGQIHIFAGPGLASAEPLVAASETSSKMDRAGRLADLNQAFPSDRRLPLFSEPLYLATREATDVDQLAHAFAAPVEIQQRLTGVSHDLAGLVSLQQDELAWLMANDSIVVGVPIDSRPVIFFNSQGQGVGLDVDFLTLLSERSSIQFSYSACGNWESCLDALATRDIDILSFASDIPARREFATFTSVYWETPWAIASAEAGVFGVDRLEDIEGKRIAITRSYSLFKQAMQLPNLQVYPVDSPEEGMIAVLEGRADGYLDSLPLLVERVREQHTGNLYLTILHGQPGDAVRLAVRSDWPVLRDILDRAVQTISDADQQQIAERWFDVNYEQGLSFADVRHWVVLLALFLLSLVVFFIWRTSRLRKEVKLRKRAEKKMRYLARHDELTGLPNRHLLDDRMKQIIASHQRYKRQFAVLFLDLDGFKDINDERGHDVGDALLKQVANRLNDSVRAQDTVCRFGGDEFIVILTEQHNATQAMQVAQKLVDRITDVYQLGSSDQLATKMAANVSVSIGVAMFPGHSRNGAELLRMADKAMYEVKREGKNGVRMASAAQ